MTMTVRPLVCAVLGLLVAMSAVTPVEAQRARGTSARRGPDPFVTVTLPRNQYFRLRMENELSSKDSRVGDRFDATVVTPVYSGGREVVPAGSTVSGRVTTVSPARTRGREGSISVRFDALRLPGGARVPIVGSLVELQDDDGGNVSDEGVLEARSGKRRNIVFVGGGAAGGAVLGGIIGGGSGAAIGTAVGAGAGIAGALLRKGHEAKVERGMEVGMALDRAASLRVRRVGVER